MIGPRSWMVSDTNWYHSAGSIGTPTWTHSRPHRLAIESTPHMDGKSGNGRKLVMCSNEPFNFGKCIPRFGLDVSQEEIEGRKDWCETIRVFEMDLMYQTDSVLNGK